MSTLPTDVSAIVRDLHIKRVLTEKVPSEFDAVEWTPSDEAAANLTRPIAQLLAAATAVYGTPPGNMDVLAQRCAERLCDKLAALTGANGGEGRVALSQTELSVLLEAALIEERAFDTARVLVMQRALLPEQNAAGLPQRGDGTLRLIRRSGQVVSWNEGKIEIAIRKSFLSLERDSEPSIAIARAVTERAGRLNTAYVSIETVQDLVQEEMIRAGHPEAAEAYILYRANRTLLRLQETPTEAPDGQVVLLPVTEEDGSSYLWDGFDLRERIRFASIGLELSLTHGQIEAELRRSLNPEMRRADVDKTILLNAKSLMERDADFAFFAGRILLTFLYAETLDWDIQRDGLAGLGKAHQTAFRAYLEHGVAIGRISERLLEYDLDILAAALDSTADLNFDYLGLQTLYDRYLITDKTGKKTRRIEVPQFFWMRVAMGLFLNEPHDKEAAVVNLYRLYKERRFCSSTPTLFNAGTKHSQLSSCYLYKVDDSIESIMYRGIAENAFLSKWAGGLGGSWTAVRGTGSYINGTNGESQGIVPFLKMHNDQLVAVNQGGKRAGSGCVYLEVWHNDIFDFLELRKNTGDDRRRTHDMNTANWIPDLFMKRMEARAHWTLFRASEVPDLHDLYGKAFETRYEHYEQMATAGTIYGKRIEALELWKQMLKMLFETGHPWMTFKDPCNVRSPQDHVGVVHSSNLCCVTADQRAVTQHGLLTIGELAARGGMLTVVGRHGTETASPMVKTIPNAPILKVVTQEGYEHRVTYDHPLWVVGKGWVEAQDLRPGDRVETQQVEGIWGDTHLPEEAFVAGLIAGDGTFSPDGAKAHIDLWQKDFHLAAELEAAVAAIIERHEIELRTNANSEPRFVPCAKGEKLRLTSAPLATALGELGFRRENKLRVPEFVWRGDRETVVAYLRGLFVADGTVQVFDGTVMSLASRSRELLRDCQILLANMGAKCSITKMRDEETKWMPDGRGGVAEYVCAPLYRLMLTGIQACRILDSAIDASGHRGDARLAERLCKAGYQQKLWATVESVSPDGREDTYCLMVDSTERAWSCNGLVTKNTEITLNTSADETAVCNLGSVVLDNHLTPEGAIDHAKLRETVRVAVRALDNVIDLNYYPTEAARRANMRHRPIGLGVMGLQYALYQKGIAFASEAALDFNDEIMEAVAYYAYEASSDLAAEFGTYESYAGSKWDRGLLPSDTVDLLQEERGLPIDVPRGGKMDWTELREKIRTQGMRNSNVLAIAPTATIANIMGTSPCIEPTYKNLFAKSNLSGDFVILNAFLVRDLKKLGLWTKEIIEQIKYFDGDLEEVAELPHAIKEKYRTAFQIPYEYLLDAAARRQKWIDQSQSLNLFLGTPDMKALSHMYRHAWRVGLKTTYYLRTLGASNIEKATVTMKKSPVAADSSANASGGPIAEGIGPRTFTEEEAIACSIEAMRNGEECEACQ